MEQISGCCTKLYSSLKRRGTDVICAANKDEKKKIIKTLRMLPDVINKKLRPEHREKRKREARRAEKTLYLAAYS